MARLDELRRMVPGLQGLDDRGALMYLQQRYAPDVDVGVIAKNLGYSEPAPDATGSRGFFRGAADMGLEVASGVTRGVGMLANTFGANNVVSRGTRSADEFIRDYLSAQSKEDSARASAILKEAEDQGIGAQVVAGLRAFAQNPASTVANTLGMAVPTIAGGMAAMGGRAAAGGARALGTMAGIGGASGVGEAKGGIFEAVKNEQQQAGMTEADATAAAEAAQAYGGPNTGNIALAGGINALGGATGFQPAAARVLGAKGMLSAATEQIEQGLLRRIGKGALVEGGTEFVQEGQQAYTQNIALQNEGFDVPTMRGVVSQGTMGAVAGGVLGGSFGALDKPSSTKPTIQDIAEAPTVDEAIKAFTNVLALPAPATKASWEVVDGQQLLQGPATQPSQPATGMLGLPAPTGQPVLMADQFGNVTTQPATQRAEAVSRANMAMAEAEQATAAQRQRAQELGKQTPRGESPPERIPVGEATWIDPIPTGDATELEQLPTGSATELDVETIQADDFLTADNQPYGTKTGAAVRARREGLGPANVVAVPGGWVVRPQPTALSPAGQEVQPNNTRGTRAGDVLRAPNVNQRDMADSSPVAVPAADGRIGDGIASGGTVRPVADAGGTGQLQPGVPTPAGSGDGNVAAGRGSGKPGSLIPAEGTPLTLDGKPYTVAAAGKRYVTIADASGKERVISDGSYLWPRVQKALAGAAPDEGTATLKRLGFAETGPGPDEWVQKVSNLGDVIAKVVSKPGEPLRAEISADYLGKRLDTRTAEGEAAIKEAIQRASDGINAGRERMARQVRADESGLPAAQTQPTIGAPNDAATPQQAAEAPRSQETAPAATAGAAVATGADTAAGVSAGVEAGGVTAARTLDEDGRASDGKPINPGDVFRTSSGRATTPYPKQRGAKYASQWLIDNARQEAETRGDDMNTSVFGGEKPLKSGELAPASRDSMLMYLFGEQPQVPRRLLKPLAPAVQAQAATTATTPPVVQPPQATAPTAPKTLKERMKAPKVYKTRANAEAAKAGNTQRIRKTKDGFILRQATDKELAAAEKAGRRLAGAGVDVEKDSLLAAIAKLGGLSIRERADTVGTGNKNVGGKMVFRLGGQPLDELAAGALREYGYVPANEVERDGGTRWLRDAIRAEFNGLNQFFSEQGTESIMERQRAQEEADFMASQEAEDIFGDLDADEVQASGYTAASPEIQAMTERLVAEAEALGVDVESIRERVSMASNGSTQDEYEFAVQQALIEAIERTRSDAARRDAGPAAGSGEDRGQAADGQGQEEGLTLEAQDAESLRAKTEREESATKAAASQKAAEQERLRREAEARDMRARADKTVDDFRLGASAEQQMSGMDDLFAAPERNGINAAPPAPRPKAITPAEAGNMRRGDIVRDEDGVEYYAWSARFGRLDVMPLKDGKPVVNNASAIRFALDDTSKLANPEYRSDPLFLVRSAAAEPVVGDMFGAKVEDVAVAKRDLDAQRRALIDLEDRMVGMAGLRPGMLEDALRSRKVPKVLKDQRDEIRNDMARLREQIARLEVPVRDMEQYIKVAADSIGELRRTDVYRVLVESNRSEFRADIATYIKANRPDLAKEVDEVLAEQEPAAPQSDNKVGDLVKLTKPGVNGPVNIAGTVTKIMPDGRLEIRTQQDGYLMRKPSELGHRAGPAPQAAADKPAAEGPKFSRAQQTKTKAFLDWFGDSKVVDANGEPLVVYHGTRAQFSVFDYTKIGDQGRAEGAGFYFTNSEKVASGYGAPMKVFLSIKKPLPYAAKGFKKPVVQQIVQRVAALEAAASGDDIADGFLSNFGDVRAQGLQAVAREAAGLIAADETALDQLSGIVGSGVNAKFVNEATRDVTGYDGVVADGFSDAGGSDNRIFVAFFQEQIKSATGNSGAFDGTNPDIRMSRATAGATTAANLRAALKTEFTPETIGALERAGLLTIADRPGRGMPSDAAGVTQGGSIGLFAANTAPGSVAVAYHEALHATLKTTVGDAYAPLMARLAKIAASAEIPQIGGRADGPMNRFFKQAAGRIPDDVTGEAWLEELAAYTVESYQANRERMPMLLRRWASDFMAAVRVGLSKALQAAGVGLRIRVRLLADPATLHKIARDGLQAMARQGMQGDAAMAFSQQAAGPKWFSALKRAVDSLSMGAAPAQGWKDSIKGLVAKGAVKADEVEWTGLNEFLDLQQGKIKKEQVQEFLSGNGVQVTETVLGSAADIADVKKDYEAAMVGQGATEKEAERMFNAMLAFSRDELHNEEQKDKGFALVMKDGSLTGNEIHDAVQDRTDTKYGQYTLPGGTNYREVLLTLPVKSVPERVEVGRGPYEARQSYGKWFIVDRRGDWGTTDYPTKEAAEAAFPAREFKETMRPTGDIYQSGHWDAPNVLAHIRVNDRVDADGKRVLFVEEIQSDWAQQGKKTGFAGADENLAEREGIKKQMAALVDQRAVARKNDDGSLSTAEQAAKLRDLTAQLEALDARMRQIPVPGNQPSRAPFVGATDKWVALALKRVVKMAVDGGYDKVAFVNGEQSADRYKLSKEVREVSWRVRRGEKNATVSLKNGDDLTFYLDANGAVQSVEGTGETTFIGKSFDDIVGKDIAAKVMADERGVLAGNGLDIGGTGMKAFYDKIIPSALKDVLRKVGGGAMETVAFSRRFDILERNGGWIVVDTKTGEFYRGDNSSKPWGDTPKIYISKAGAERAADALDASSDGPATQPGFTITESMRDKASQGMPLFSRAAPNASPGTGWAMPEASRFDDFVYKFQDKNVDLKRAVAEITKGRQALEDRVDAYLQEELFHERAAKRTQDFTKDELGPIMKDMAARGITLEALDEYLHNRHAEEANKVAAERNKDADGNSTMPDGGSGIKTADARAYLAKLDPGKRKRLEAVAAKVDSIIAKTRQTLVDYGLESQAVTDGWASQFEHYVPLMREDEGGGMGTGQGFSIKGKESKSRTGSTDRKVVDILANIAMQRERAIVRGEKNRVAVAMVGLVDANPAPDFWQADSVPTERVFNERTGLVEERQILGFKNRPNVLVAKVMGPNGEVQERAIVFNERNQRAMRMAESLKNLDASELEGLLGVSAKITRYFAAINTQYNPVFGFVNFIRDVQGAIINLQSTALKGSEKAVMKDVMPALAGVYADARKVRQGGVATSKWANLWEEFQNEGGATGFRDLFRTSEDRANAIKREIDPTAWMNSPMGKVFTANGNLKVPLAQAQKGATWIFDWLSDYNLAMENAVRLSAYKAALDQGMTKQRAASLAKNLTVNFNRKGQAGMQAGAVYAFFNAAMQGTARMGDVMFEGQGAGQRLSSLGRKIIYGGMALGAMQAMALAAAGFDEDEPPPFVRERSLVIPIGALVGGKEYISIPMPLGWHVIPGLGREATEFALSGFKDPGKRLVNLVALFADAFNPIGNAGMSLQTISPTALDPLVALSENRDWTGKPIARESFDRTTPGFALAKDTASAPAKWISEMINAASGGTQYTAGILSPTPDQIDYLWGQVTGGVGRELGKVEQTVTAAFTGETLPTYKVPLVGRFVGDAEGPTSQGNRFYENLNQINLHEAQIKGLRKDGKTEEVAQYLADNPEASLISIANMAERQVRRMRARKRELLANDAPREDIQQIEVQITNAMTRLNEAVKRRELAGV